MILQWCAVSSKKNTAVYFLINWLPNLLLKALTNSIFNHFLVFVTATCLMLFKWTLMGWLHFNELKTYSVYLDREEDCPANLLEITWDGAGGRASMWCQLISKSSKKTANHSILICWLAYVTFLLGEKPSTSVLLCKMGNGLKVWY